MKFYNTRYNNSPDTLHPQFELQGRSLYSTTHNLTEGSKVMPWFEVRGKNIFPTLHNPQSQGASQSHMPWYQIRGSAVYTTSYHPSGSSHLPVFHIKEH
jgi:hypothetical protein